MQEILGSHNFVSFNHKEAELEEVGFGRQVYESEDFVIYNTIVEAIIRELVDDGIVLKQQKESTPDDPEDRYEVTQNLDRICKDFRDSLFMILRLLDKAILW